MRALVLGLTAVTFTTAHAQYTFSNVKLYKQYTLAQMGASSGNSCWGYVSPSGREFALMGLSNKVAFIEITDPNNPNYFANIPHTSGSWADIKTYKSACYVGTEASGSGVQVIDLSDIDNLKVTLVKTITNPGRTHTLHVDNASGFLYCCGSRESLGSTMCFDLTNPLNPVRVGSNSLTGTYYQHETIVQTYTQGPYAGKQVMFSGGADRGLEIWDVTNKNAVTLIRRIAYPFVGYCHQSWISGDRKYLYVNDELDEMDFPSQIPKTRTLVFDVSVLETADLVATFTTNKTSIDHNLYWKNGFIFEGNYTTGLNVFDATGNPVAPVLRGFFDTYPSNDGATFNGLWSNYPFFPSGTVVGCDINRGVFIWDVSEATKTMFPSNDVVTVQGRVVSGGPGDVGAEDGKYMVVAKGSGNQNDAPIQLVFEGKCLWTDISRLQFNLRDKVSTRGLQYTIELYDWTTNSWVQTTTGAASTTDTTVTATAANPDRFVDPVSRGMKARLQIRQGGPTMASDWGTSIDLANWTVNP